MGGIVIGSISIFREKIMFHLSPRLGIVAQGLEGIVVATGVSIGCISRTSPGINYVMQTRASMSVQI